VAAGLPLVSALVGIGTSVAAIIAATVFVGIGSATPTLAVMLGLAVAIDYSLFMLTRYRSGSASRGDRRAAIVITVSTAGPMVVFAGATVVVALVGLTWSASRCSRRWRSAAFAAFRSMSPWSARWPCDQVSRGAASGAPGWRSVAGEPSPTVHVC
jgi:uncharacterized membrane protein YdfJ with MMPL/SSD domain